MTGTGGERWGVDERRKCLETGKCVESPEETPTGVLSTDSTVDPVVAGSSPVVLANTKPRKTGTCGACSFSGRGFLCNTAENLVNRGEISSLHPGVSFPKSPPPATARPGASPARPVG